MPSPEFNITIPKENVAPKGMRYSQIVGQFWRRFKLLFRPADQFSITLSRRQDCRLEGRA